MAAKKRRPTRGGKPPSSPKGKAEPSPRAQRSRAGRSSPASKPATRQPTQADARAATMRRPNPIADKLDTAQAVKTLEKGSSIQVSMPDLKGVKVEVQAPPPPDDEHVDRRIEELARIYAPYTSRDPGQPIEMGDEILVDAVGYVHGDLKPENILLKSRDKSGIKVIDFGSSCFAD